MAKQLKSPALRRLRQFFRVLRWLASHAFAKSATAVFASTGLIIASILVQVAAVILSVAVIEKLVPRADTFETAASQSSIQAFVKNYALDIDTNVLIVMVTGLFIASTVLLYFGRVMTLRVESNVVEGAEAAGLAAFAAMQKKSPQDPPDIAIASRLTGLGARASGRICRLMLRSVAEFGFLFAGLVLLFLLSPWIFVALFGFILVGVALNYPISLASYQTAKDFEAASGPRRQAIREALMMLRDNPDAANDLKNTPQQTAFLTLLRRRLKILEVARLAFGLFFGVALTVVLFLVSTGAMSALINLTSLFLLVVVFRYIFTGFKGVMVLVTTTNRFIPNVVRLHAMVTQHELASGIAMDDDDDDEE